MKKESKVNQAKYVELNLFPEEKEDHQKDSISSEDMESDTSPDKEYDLTDLFERLSKSTFRSRFHLSKKDKEYIAEKGLATIRKHAEDFVAKRLAPAVIPNDGKQTPMRGHSGHRHRFQPCRDMISHHLHHRHSSGLWLHSDSLSHSLGTCGRLSPSHH